MSDKEREKRKELEKIGQPLRLVHPQIIAFEKEKKKRQEESFYKTESEEYAERKPIYRGSFEEHAKRQYDLLAEKYSSPNLEYRHRILPNNTCYYCSDPLSLITKTIDHIIPKIKRGNNRKVNKVTCCYICNQLKTDLTLEEFADKIMKLESIAVERRSIMVRNIKDLIPYRDANYKKMLKR